MSVDPRPVPPLRRWPLIGPRVTRAVRRRVAAGFGRGLSALILPVPAAQQAVSGGYIALISPFLPRNQIDEAVVGRVDEIVSSFEPFDFTLARVGRFPQGVLYLAPEPSEPFVELVGAFCDEWPDHPPYEGEYDSVVPHLTVWFARLLPLLTKGADPEPPGLADELSRALPIDATARHVDLIVMDQKWHWSRRASFPLGGGEIGGPIGSLWDPAGGAL